MALVVEDRVCETSTTATNGAFTLAGAITGFRTFASVCSTNDTCYYCIQGVDANGVATGEWETGLGTYSSANTLTRTTPQRSSNANAAVTFSAGTKRVFIDATQGYLALLAKLVSPSFTTPTADSLAIAGTAGAGFTSYASQSSVPSTPASGTVIFYAANAASGVTRLEMLTSTGTSLALFRDSVDTIRNSTGSQIDKGKLVYINGSNGTTPTVALAKADAAATSAAIGFAVANIANNAFGTVQRQGVFTGVDTSGFSAGDTLWVSAATAGAVTNTEPAAPNFGIKVGTVVTSNSNGIVNILVQPFVPSRNYAAFGTSSLGVATATTWNGNAITAGTGTITITGTKTLTVSDTATVSGTNTGDATTTTEGALINGATDKATPVDADYVGLMDSAASNVLKKLSWANVKAMLKTYFDGIYSALATVNTFTKAQRGAFVALTDASTVAVDASLANQFRVLLAGNRTLGVPTNLVEGQQGVINVRQDTTGSRTLAYSWCYRWAGGTAGVLSTAGCTEDQLVYSVDVYATASVTITVATPGVVTWTAHGLLTGQQIQLTTSGTLPTGLTASTTYFWTTVDANSGKLSTSLANCAAGTFIATTGSAGTGHTGTAISIKMALNKAYS